MRLEEQGRPVALVATDAFRRSVAEQLEAIAFAAFEPVYVPHPVAGLPPDEIHHKADAALPQVLARLTGTEPTEWH